MAATYQPEVAFDLPSGDDRVEAVLAAAEIPYGDTQHYRSSDQVSDELARAVREALDAATDGHVDATAFELNTIDFAGARVEIKGTFETEQLPDDFDAFAKEGGSA